MPDPFEFPIGWAEPQREAAPAPPTADDDPTRNLLLDPGPVEYAFERTPLGEWKRHLAPDGKRFREFTSHRRFGKLPLVHMTFGRDPATRRFKTAKGVFAVGRRAVGVVAAGQLAVGVVAFGQLALGLLFGLGQATTGAVCVGQAAFGAVCALGQLAVADVAVGQFAVGRIALGQFGFGGAVMDVRGVDPAARQWVRQVLGM